MTWTGLPPFPPSRKPFLFWRGGAHGWGGTIFVFFFYILFRNFFLVRPSPSPYVTLLERSLVLFEGPSFQNSPFPVFLESSPNLAPFFFGAPWRGGAPRGPSGNPRRGLGFLSLLPFFCRGVSFFFPQPGGTHRTPADSAGCRLLHLKEAWVPLCGFFLSSSPPLTRPQQPDSPTFSPCLRISPSVSFPD